MRISVDLNCDMGEGIANDAAIMPYISSANIACGYHAGSEEIMQQTILLALKHNVKIGAHPSYPDRENFGRSNMIFSPSEICELVKNQIELLASIAHKNNCILHHVKPHGALYNMASRDKTIAIAICEAILKTDSSLIVYAQSGSELIRAANSMNLKTCSEVFSDRTYQIDGTLTPRTLPNALITNENEVIAQVLLMVTEQSVFVNGISIPVVADTICIHGDGEHALYYAKSINEVLKLNNIIIKPN